MSDENLPLASKENFLAEVEVVDLSEIKNELFLVAVGTGEPHKVKFLCTTVHGPFDFVEMLQEVGDMWHTHQHHAKVVILSKNSSQAVKILDPNIIDYIECHYNDLITEEMLGGAFDKKYTCKVAIAEAGALDDPRNIRKNHGDEKDADDKTA